ncbi:unnamed protein product [Arctogadus glacialis]
MPCFECRRMAWGSRSEQRCYKSLQCRTLPHSRRAANPPGPIMKFVALALTILLAVGSQAQDSGSVASVQLAKIQDGARLYLSQVQDHAQRTLDRLDGTEYEQYKVKLTEYAQTLAPYADAFSTGFSEAHARTQRDMEALLLAMEPRRQELQALLQKQTEEYRVTLEPIFQEYVGQSLERVESLKARLQPLLEEMRAKMEANVEETKTKVMPLVEGVRSKLTERLEQLRTMASPYVDQYQEQVSKAVGDASDSLAPHTKDLQAKLEPLVEDLKAKFDAVYKSFSDIVQA